MSSTAGFQPLPGNGTYSAAKSFVLFHSETLHEEVRGRGVTVTAVCPGPVHTEFQETSEPLFMARMPRFLQRDAGPVAAETLRAVEAGKRTIVPGGAAAGVLHAKPHGASFARAADRAPPDVTRAEPRRTHRRGSDSAPPSVPWLI